jgi:hypothetical protein
MLMTLYKSVVVSRREVPDGKYICMNCGGLFEGFPLYYKVIPAVCNGQSDIRGGYICDSCHDEWCQKVLESQGMGSCKNFPFARVSSDELRRCIEVLNNKKEC